MNAGANSSNRSLLNRQKLENAAHLHIIRKNQPSIADPLLENRSDPISRSGRRAVAAARLRIGGMVNHDHWQFRRKLLVRNEILAPQFSPCPLNSWRFQVRIEAA